MSSPTRFTISSPLRQPEENQVTPAAFGIMRSDLLRIGQAVNEVYAELGRLRGDCAASVTTSNETMEQLKDVVQWKATQQDYNLQEMRNQAKETFEAQRVTMANITGSAQKEFDTQRTKIELAAHQVGQTAEKLQELYQHTAQAVQALEKRVKAVEEGGQWHGGSGDRGGERRRSYLPENDLKPKNFAGKLETWRTWRQDFQTFMGAANPGMGEFLQELGDERDFPDEEWMARRHEQYGQKVTGDSAEVWRTLKALVDEAAYNVLASIKPGEGFLAWHHLARNYEPSLESMSGKALSDLNVMMSKKATNPAETRQLMQEMDAKMRLVEDLSGAPMDNRHQTSILKEFLDPVTRAHTYEHQGGGNFANFRREVLKFCNGNITVNQTTGGGSRGAQPMEWAKSFIGQFNNGDQEAAVPEEENWDPTCANCNAGYNWNDGSWGDENINAMNGSCHSCGQFGHYARNCPRNKGKGKGKGFQNFGQQQKGFGKKGGGKSFPNYGVKGGNGKGGKGKGAGPPGGCYGCGGPHLQRNCPMQGPGGLRALAESPVQKLSLLTTVEPEWTVKVSRKAETSQKTRKLQRKVELQKEVEQKKSEVKAMNSGRFHALKDEDIFTEYPTEVIISGKAELDASCHASTDALASLPSTCTCTGWQGRPGYCGAKDPTPAGTAKKKKADIFKKQSKELITDEEKVMPILEDSDDEDDEKAPLFSEDYVSKELREARGHQCTEKLAKIIESIGRTLEVPVTDVRSSDLSGSGAEWLLPADEPAKAKPLCEECSPSKASQQRSKIGTCWAFEDREILDTCPEVMNRSLKRNGGHKTWSMRSCGVQKISMFETIYPESVNAVDADDEWEKIEFHVDSGATETVLSEAMLMCVATKPGLAMKQGIKYEVANGVRIDNLGEKNFKGMSKEGFFRSMTAQVCDVNKALLSVKKVIAAGNQVVFGSKEGSYIESNATGERMWLEERGGMYILELWVKKADF